MGATRTTEVPRSLQQGVSRAWEGLEALWVGARVRGLGQGAGSEWLPPPQAQDESHSFTLTIETNTATVTQLSPGHIYGFQVRARTAAGHGPFGGKVYFQTLPQGERKPGQGGRGTRRW